ncbi:hypothetical protein OS493_009335 [Desmophyllum pertusum]|uniref:Uncharacterized protein n=1 Tax=Desmophyllum pertusum TaxID=174260 RepID=A0A9X0CS42_9CNID|nr:hypothetical protein OS493_009335 [Desmophyllum pertusum]
MKPLVSTVGWVMIVILEAAFGVLAAVNDPVLCHKPMPKTVAVDESRHRFYPYFVQLYQCQGSWGHESPNIKKCVATGWKEIKLTVYSTATWVETQVTVHNHTSCGPECTASATCDLRVQRWNEQRCKCDCLYQGSPPPNNIIKRKDGFRWNKNLCSYECNRPHAFCSEKKIWSRKDCSCVCRPFYKMNCEDDKKHLDPETCECKEAGLLRGQRPGFFTYPASRALVAVLVWQYW